MEQQQAPTQEQEKKRKWGEVDGVQVTVELSFPPPPAVLHTARRQASAALTAAHEASAVLDDAIWLVEEAGRKLGGLPTFVAQTAGLSPLLLELQKLHTRAEEVVNAHSQTVAELETLTNEDVAQALIWGSSVSRPGLSWIGAVLKRNPDLVKKRHIVSDQGSDQ